jgi:hypothetical protein
MQFSMRNLPEWQTKIIRKFPSLYLERNPAIMEMYKECPQNLDEEHYCNLRFGFECGSGWAGLIEEFSAVAVSLVEALRSSGLQPEARIQSCIVKEKFGLLRWQGDTYLIKPFRELYFAYVHWIESRSGSICERSGKFGQMRQINGWLTTLSDEEYKRELRRRTSEEP